MTPKEYLRQLNVMRGQLRSVQRKIEELNLEAISIGAIRYDTDRVQTSPEDHLPAMVGELLDVENKYQRMLARYHRAVQARIQMIEKLDNPVYVRVLMLRYCDGMTFEQIATEMVYSYRQILRIHGNALSAFGRKHAAELEHRGQ